MKVILLPVLLFLLTFNGYCQTMQATIKPGSTPRTIDIYLKPSQSFMQKDEAMTFVLAIPATVSPGPTMVNSIATPDTLGPVSGITGLQPDFLYINFGATSRAVVVDTETINTTSYYIYTFIFAGTAATNHSWTGDAEQQIFSVQFNGCTSNCDPLNELLVNLPNGGTNGNAYWYFQPNTLGDITNYPAPFYANAESGTPDNGGSSDGSALSTIALATPVVLPIKLRSFNTKVNGCNVSITWEATTEVDAGNFRIERSIDGTSFSEIGNIEASKQNNNFKTYVFLDNSAPSGELYYRLRMINKDGSQTYSPVKGAALNCSGKGSILIYPTVTKGSININLVSGYENAKIRIVNSLGQEVAFDVAKNLIRNINLKGLASGIYMVQVIKNNKITDNVKIVLAQ